MTETLDTINNLLLLNSNERVILPLLDKYATPLELARHTKIPRPTIYLTLEKLKARGLIKRKKENNKLFWTKVSDKELQYSIQNLQKTLIQEETGEEKKKSLSGDEAKVFTGTEKYGKHTPNYYSPNSLQPHYTRAGKDKVVGYYTYDLDINGHIFRMTKPMEEFEIATGTNIKK
ncbi:MAG: helix-turn-helix domain-containing protein [bacterium]